MARDTSDRLDATIDHVEAAAYTIPTDAPESDGTIAWDSTTIVIVHATGGSTTGIGYAYADGAAASLVERTLARVVTGRRVADVIGANGDGPGVPQPGTARHCRWRDLGD